MALQRQTVAGLRGIFTALQLDLSASASAEITDVGATLRAQDVHSGRLHLTLQSPLFSAAHFAKSELGDGNSPSTGLVLICYELSKSFRLVLKVAERLSGDKPLQEGVSRAALGSIPKDEEAFMSLEDDTFMTQPSQTTTNSFTKGPCRRLSKT